MHFPDDDSRTRAVEENADLFDLIGVTDQSEYFWNKELGVCKRMCCAATRTELEASVLDNAHDRGFDRLECDCNHMVGLLGCE